MIPLDSIRGFFPPALRTPAFARHLLKEYVECLALDWIARSAWARDLAFIGGTCLRLAMDVDRFSEDLDFAAWVSDYAAASDAYAVCRPLATVGRFVETPAVRLHDDRTRCASSLPLA